MTIRTFSETFSNRVVDDIRQIVRDIIEIVRRRLYFFIEKWAFAGQFRPPATTSLSRACVDNFNYS